MKRRLIWLLGWVPWPFSEYAWYRRWLGGHWEHWIIDHPGPPDIWLQLEPDDVCGMRPPLGRGTPHCEDWD